MLKASPKVLRDHQGAMGSWSRPPQVRRRRVLLFWGIYLSLVIMLIIGSGEIATRRFSLAPFDEWRGDYTSDPYLPFKPKPNLITTVSTTEFSHEVRHNSLGFRDVEHSVQKPPHTFRIVALGDSFTYGIGARYEQTYLVGLEALLNQQEPTRVHFEVIKMGIPRYFPATERLVLQHYGLQYKPDLVLVAFVPNDVIDTSLGSDAVAVSENGNLITDVAASLGEGGMWLYRKSHLARLVLNRTIPMITSLKHPVQWNEIYQDNGFHENDWRQIEDEYLRMQSLAEGIHARLVLISIPQNGDLVENDRLRYTGQRLAKFSAQHGIEFIDTLPAMAEIMRISDKPLYWENDGHCTGQGYQVLAQAIFEALIQKGLIPNKASY